MDNDNANWDNIPHTDAGAYPIIMRHVRNVRAINIAQGSIRSAPVSGVFELATDEVNPIVDHPTYRDVEVKCFWYQHKPKTTWMHVKVLAESEVIESYTGFVIGDIGR